MFSFITKERLQIVTNFTKVYEMGWRARKKEKVQLLKGQEQKDGQVEEG